MFMKYLCLYHHLSLKIIKYIQSDFYQNRKYKIVIFI